jgi:hypothetical protein
MEYDEKHDDTWAEEIVREYVPEDELPSPTLRRKGFLLRRFAA